ncbi:MAG: fumarylacetoacetate hydrolase family protein [Burkholderiaceae bacterium]|jgi:fumarylacetoacetate (FAA) hydrolase|nr:fumarylacetoacetate hydrolase family protein [Burkholderiaceae bacterium]
MKLATYSDGSRDGQLVVVSRDLTQAHYASGIAGRLQTALDDWNFYAPQLQELAAQLDAGKARHAFAFDPARCLAPLPRAYQRLDGVQTEDMPRVVQCASDALLSARSPICVAAGADGLDLSARLAVITGDVPPGATPEQGQDAIRLVTLINTFYWRADGGDNTSPATALGPVAVTPDEFGAAWQDGRLRLILSVAVNDRKLGLIEMGRMRWSFGDLIAHAARLRPLAAGTLVGSGAVGDAEGARGFASLSDKRAFERAREGQPHTPWLGAGDVVRIELKGADGASVFGAIEQTAEAAEKQPVAIKRGAIKP